MNDLHLKQNPGDAELSARIAAYELAGRMQQSAPEVGDLSQEGAATRALYGLNSPNPLTAVDRIIAEREADAAAFYAELAPPNASDDERLVQRRALAGLLWTKQIYLFDVARWLDGDASALSVQEQDGYRLFKSAGCIFGRAAASRSLSSRQRR